MKLSAALQYENQPRSEADWNKIYLNHDGKFFHAYEWSAWLIKAVACTEEYQQQRGDAKMLSAMLYTTKNSEYIITGFPLDSIGKYIPQYVSMNPVEDGGGDLIIEIELPQEWDGMTQEQMEEAFREWRSQQPVKEPKGKGTPQNHAARTADVMHMGRGQAFHTVNSLLGVMSHYSSYNIRREIFTQQHILRYGSFDRDMTTFTLSKPVAAMCA